MTASLLDIGSVQPVAMYMSKNGLEFGIIRNDKTTPARAIYNVKDQSPSMVLASVQTYTLTHGETLDDIAALYGCTVDDMLAFNSGLSENSSDSSVDWKLMDPRR